MTTFAPGTNRDYANAHSNWWFGGGSQRGESAPRRQAFGPDANGTTPASGPGGAPQYYAQQPRQTAFRPGMAQPIQPQSTGTPYGRPANMSGAYGGQPGGDMASWSTRGAAPAAIGGSPVTQYGPDSYGSARGENPFSGIQPFTQTLSTPYGQMDPGQYYQQRDAFIQSANSQMGQYMPGGPSSGQPPQFNPQQMWWQAGQMVEQGWQNPFASQSMAPRGQGAARQGGLIDIDSGFYGDQGYQGQYGPGDRNQPIPTVARGIGAWDQPVPAPGGAKPGLVGGRGGAPQGPAEASGDQSQRDWRARHAAQIASPANRRWLQSQSPANRRAYRALQGLY